MDCVAGLREVIVLGVTKLGGPDNRELMADDEDRVAVFERLFAAHYWAVRSYVLRRAPSSAVEDVVADTFLVAWRAGSMRSAMIRCRGCSGSRVAYWQTSTALSVAEAR